MNSQYPLWLQALMALRWVVCIIVFQTAGGGEDGFLAMFVASFGLIAMALFATCLMPEVTAEMGAWFDFEQERRPYTWWIL